MQHKYWKNGIPFVFAAQTNSEHNQYPNTAVYEPEIVGFLKSAEEEIDIGSRECMESCTTTWNFVVSDILMVP